MFPTNYYYGYSLGIAKITDIENNGANNIRKKFLRVGIGLLWAIIAIIYWDALY